MLYILWGQDEYSLYETLAGIKKSLGDQSLLEINTTALDGKQLAVEELKTVCETAPFMTEKRLVVVSGLLGRFETKGRSNSRKKGSTAKQQEEQSAFITYISRIPDSTVLVLVDDEQIKSTNPLLSALSSKAKVQSFPLLRGVRLQQWIQKCVVRAGGTITSQAVNLMMELVGSNLRVMMNEIDKLVLYTGGRRIEEGDVRSVVSYAQESSIFSLVDAIIAFKAGLAGQSLQNLLQRGASPSYILAMLTRQARLMARIKELKASKVPENEIQSRTGLASDFAWRKTLEQSQQSSTERIRKIYGKLLETDMSIKTGKYDSELALNLLVAELCHRGE